MLRKMLVGLATATAAAVAAAPAGAQTPAEDSVVGTAALPGNSPFIFDAHSGSAGEQAHGTLSALLPGGPTITSQVTCLNVSANRATIGFRFESGIGGLVFVEDNNGVGADRFIGLGQVLDPAPVVCPAGPPVGLELLPIESGDIIVIDAPSTPTSKDQCKNGGWRTYGVFKNQGDCVSLWRPGGRIRRSMAPELLR